MSEQIEMEIEVKQIKLPEIKSIQVKMPNVKPKENVIDFTELTEAVQESFPFMNLH